MSAERLTYNHEKLLDQMKKYYPRVTAKAALEVAIFISKLHADWPKLPGQKIIEQWKFLIDKKAQNIMSDELNSIPFHTISVGSEGKKEKQYAGKEAPSLQGKFGSNKHPKCHKVSDVVEGTTFAVNNQPGASSAIAVTIENGIMSTPDNTHYMIKLIAPPQAKNIMSLENSHEDNLRNLIKALKISPKDLIQITLNPAKKGREINQQFVDAAYRTGLTKENVLLIDAGDYVPSLLAILDPEKSNRKPMIVVGRGGFEEGLMAAAAAKAVGGFMEAKEFNKDLTRTTDNQLWKLDDLVPAPKDSILVSTSFITDDLKWFKQPGVRKHTEKTHMVTTLVITHEGLEFGKIQLKSP